MAVAQPKCTSYDITVNAATHADVVRSAEAQVVVFPELSLTGYELDASAITAADPRLAPIIQACAATGSLALVLVGASLRGVDGREHIAMPAIDGQGAASPIARCGWGPPKRNVSRRAAGRQH
jgi:predicted amidohydrolase